MINLLPPEIQESYQYAHRNHQLLRWASLCGLGFVGLALISIGGIFYLQQATNSYAQQIASAEATLSVQKQAATDKQAKAVSDRIKLAVQVLSKEVLFSALLKQIAATIPDNASLANLTISQVKGALDITANTASYDAATQLQVNLADPSNKVFSKADIISIACTSTVTGGSSDTAANRYPCKVSIRALFATDNPFLFTHNSTKTTKGQTP